MIIRILLQNKLDGPLGMGHLFLMIFLIVDQFGAVAVHSQGILDHSCTFLLHLEGFLRHFGEFLDNGTQFKCIIGFIW